MSNTVNTSINWTAAPLSVIKPVKHKPIDPNLCDNILNCSDSKIQGDCESFISYLIKDRYTTLQASGYASKYFERNKITEQTMNSTVFNCINYFFNSVNGLSFHSGWQATPTWNKTLDSKSLPRYFDMLVNLLGMVSMYEKLVPNKDNDIKLLLLLSSLSILPTNTKINKFTHTTQLLKTINPILLFSIYDINRTMKSLKNNTIIHSGNRIAAIVFDVKYWWLCVTDKELSQVCLDLYMRSHKLTRKQFNSKLETRIRSNSNKIFVSKEFQSLENFAQQRLREI